MTKSLRIAVLGTRGFPDVQGGVETHCENLYPRLSALGCEVIVFVRFSYVDVRRTSYKNVRLIPIDCPRNKYFETIVYCFRSLFRLWKLKPDIVHVHCLGPALVIPLLKLMGFKIVVTSHGPEYERKKWNIIGKMALKLGETLMALFSDEIICIADYLSIQLRRRYHTEAHTIPNGVVLRDVMLTEGVLKKYKLEKNKYILAVGRFVPEKGFHDLIDAFALMPNKDWKLAIVGSADHEDSYSRSLKEKTKNNTQIVLTGFLTGQPLAELYSHAGIFTVPSYYEGLPIVLLEAMSYGLPCLASNIAANREVRLEESRYFKPGDVPMLTEKLKKFIGTPFSGTQRQEQIRQVSEKYDWMVVAKKTLEVYQKVTKNA